MEGTTHVDERSGRFKQHERSSFASEKLTSPVTVRAESGLQKWKKMKTYQVIKIYFAEEKGFDLLNS